MGRPFDGRVDQYSLAMTVHEVLERHQLHGGPDPVGDGGQPDDGRAPGLDRADPGYPRVGSPTPFCGGWPRTRPSVSRIAWRWPRKSWRRFPRRRPPVRNHPCPSRRRAVSRGGYLVRPARPRCPWVASTREGRVRCTQCHATSLVSLLSSNTVQLKLSTAGRPRPVSPSAVVARGSRRRARSSTRPAATVIAERPDRARQSGRCRDGPCRDRGSVLIGWLLGWPSALGSWRAVRRGPWSRSPA